MRKNKEGFLVDDNGKIVPLAGGDFDMSQFDVVNVNRPVDLFQPQYDRANFAVTTTGDTSFFSVPKGQAATLVRAAVTGSYVKTDRDTSMQTAGVAPAKAFMAMGISIAYMPASLATNVFTAQVDRRLMSANLYMKINVVDASVFVLPLIAIPLLNPVIALAGGETTGSVYAEAPGGGPIASLYRLPTPITIGANRNFSCTVTTDGTLTITTSHDMYVFLHTFMRRPGQ
jgi:hypothetical protein